jgi:hypothetical protein
VYACIHGNGFIPVTRRREGKDRMEINQQLARLNQLIGLLLAERLVLISYDISYTVTNF